MTRGLPSEHGYSLVEMLIVMALMGIVIGGLTTVFVSGSGAENNLNQEFQAQQTARLALDRLRGDVHCASTATYNANINGHPGMQLAVSGCWASTTVTWCILASTKLGGRYALWRTTLNTASTCTAADTQKLLQADDLMLTPATILTTTCASKGLPSVGIDFKVNVNSASKSSDTYELKDNLVTRNSTRCP